MKNSHDCDSVVSALLLYPLQVKYSILTMFDLQVSRPDQCPCNPVSRSFWLSRDTLKGGFCLSFHLVIVLSCPQWLKIFLSEMVPNSQRCLIVFIEEYWRVDITLTHKLFIAYFQLSKGKSSYYLVAREGFKISGAPSKVVRRSTSFSQVQVMIEGLISLVQHITYITSPPPLFFIG